MNVLSVGCDGPVQVVPCRSRRQGIHRASSVGSATVNHATRPILVKVSNVRTSPGFLEATQTAYDTFAAAYAEQTRDWLDAAPFDQAMVVAFIELVRAAGPG